MPVGAPRAPLPMHAFCAVKQRKKPFVVDSFIHRLLIKHLSKNLQKIQKTQNFLIHRKTTGTGSAANDLPSLCNYTGKLTLESAAIQISPRFICAWHQNVLRGCICPSSLHPIVVCKL
jgi:hypothetical protein